MDLEYLKACITSAEAGQKSFGEQDASCAVSGCPLVQASVEQIVLIPRKPENIFRENGHRLRTLLPDRYPAAGSPLKTIEYNFYPDLNMTRTVTAIVTESSWEPGADERPAPRSGVTVYFALGPQTTADATLSADSATSDAEGRAAIDVTIKKLVAEKATFDAVNKVEIIASLVPACAPGNPTVLLTVHRNEDVDAALAPSETPDDFAAVLQPVLNLDTWIVQQAQHAVESNGAKAVQQLLNQVSCRREGGGHQFCKPDGQFGPGSAAEAGRFITDFSAKPAAGSNAVQNYSQRRFGVSVEENTARTQGVKTYVEKEYGSYTEGHVIDAHLLTGTTAWAAGSAIMSADGLLDIHRAVVWEFIDAMRARGEEYANVAVTWCRHPNDGASNGAAPWPDTVSQGVAYWYGGARSRSEFETDASAACATPPAALQTWFQYLRQNNRRIGLHGSGDIIVVPTNAYQQYAHLNTDADVTNVAPQGQPPSYRLNHPFTETIKRQYTGIDCSAFCQHIAYEAQFRAGHCSDLTNERICRHLPEITHQNGLAQNRLSTSTWPAHYRNMAATTWRRQIVFRGDVLNQSGHHIVALETADRAVCTAAPAIPSLWIYHANGQTTKAVALNGIWDPTECIRRVVYSPLRQWSTAWTAWGANSANVQFGRIYLWA